MRVRKDLRPVGAPARNRSRAEAIEAEFEWIEVKSKDFEIIISKFAIYSVKL